MIDLLKYFLNKKDPNGASNQKKQPVHDLQVATCALFLEMANIDGEFAEMERKRIIAILKRDFDVPDEEINTLLKELPMVIP